MPTNPTHKDDCNCGYGTAGVYIHAPDCLAMRADHISDAPKMVDREADDSPAIPEEPFPKWDVCRDCCDGSHAGLKCTVCDGKGHVPFKPTPASHTAPDALRATILALICDRMCKALGAVALDPDPWIREMANDIASLTTPAPSRDDVERAVTAEREACAAIADKWAAENKTACAKARKGPDQGNMADMLDGAAIECNAIAGAIRERSALNKDSGDVE